MKPCFLVKAVVGVLLLAPTFQGCGAGDLNRGKSKLLIDAHKTLREAELKFYSYGCPYEMWTVSGNRATLNAEGKKYFKNVSGDSLVKVTAQSEAHVLEVTGITGEERVKSVGFTWQFKDVPDVVKQCCQRLPHGDFDCSETLGTRTGRATVALYDDGWRVTDVSLDSPRPTPNPNHR